MCCELLTCLRIDNVNNSFSEVYYNYNCPNFNIDLYYIYMCGYLNHFTLLILKKFLPFLNPKRQLWRRCNICWNWSYHYHTCLLLSAHAPAINMAQLKSDSQAIPTRSPQIIGQKIKYPLLKCMISKIFPPPLNFLKTLKVI